MLDRTIDALLARRNARGAWTGRLADSALSTATAAFALARLGPRGDRALVAAGLRWLVESQNAGGGWGDTPDSLANPSTTALAWAALAEAPSAGIDARDAVAAAERWLTGHFGSPAPGDVAAGITRRYGDDRTFSAPILTMGALAGRLGDTPGAWRYVAQLPFELAALPQGTFRLLRLPVVSYALPALIAIGMVRHAHRPSGNPLARAVRRLARRRTLRVLGAIQPDSGGYLEAAPLTSFVLMCLCSLPEPEPTGRAPQGPSRIDPLPHSVPVADEVISRCAAFLRNTVRDDGAWPIDTDLATWVTTLAVNALPASVLDRLDRRGLADDLLARQQTARHPYTGAAPGGWAWTDLSGGVPDADDTAGALRALRRLAPDDPRARRAAAEGCRWLLDLQNRDGGIPTFCRGWNRLPFDRSAPDLTAHALLAWRAWRNEMPASIRRRIERAAGRAVRYLHHTQDADGAWTPLWFGNQHCPGQTNRVYGTARVVLALARLAGERAATAATRGGRFLLAAQRQDGGFSGDVCDAPPSVEETAVATEALARLADAMPAEPSARFGAAARAGADWLARRTDAGRSFPAAPIGLYFARLWYAEDLYPMLFTTAALTALARER